MEWYYAEGQQQIGPINQTEFNTLISARQIKEETLVWCDEMADWQTYGSLKNTDNQNILETISLGQPDALGEIDQLSQQIDAVQIDLQDQLLQADPIGEIDQLSQQIDAVQLGHQTEQIQATEQILLNETEQIVQPTDQILQDNIIQPAHSPQSVQLDLQDQLLQPSKPIPQTEEPAPLVQPIQDVLQNQFLSQNLKENKCSKCGHLFPEEKMTFHKDTWTCISCKPKLIQKVKEDIGPREVIEPPPQMKYIGFWKRAMAKIFDIIILGSLSFAIAYSASKILGMITDSTIVIATLTVSGISLVALWLGYTTIFLGKFGATPGKIIFRSKVVTTDGDKISYTRALGRLFAEVLSVATLCLGYIIIIFDKKKRGIHDHICRTRVIRR